MLFLLCTGVLAVAALPRAKEVYYFRHYFDPVPEKLIPAELYVENIFATDKNTTIHKLLYHEHADICTLPLIEALKALGYNVDSQYDNLAKVTYEEKKFLINTDNCSFIQTVPYVSEELIQPLIGGYVIDKSTADHEIIVDEIQFESIMESTGDSVWVNWDMDSQRVNVSRKSKKEILADISQYLPTLIDGIRFEMELKLK